MADTESNTEGNLTSRPGFREALSALFGPAPWGQPDPLNFANIGCGLGGASLAAKGLGFKVVYAVEEDEAAREAYAINIGIEPDAAVSLNLKKLPRIDLLWASLPPEALAPGEPGREESAYEEAMRVVRVRRPGGVVLECRLWWGQGVDEAIERLEVLKYRVSQHTLWGRCFIVGTLCPRLDLWEEGDPTPPVGNEDVGKDVRMMLRNKGFPPGWRMPRHPEMAARLASEALSVELTTAVIGWVSAVMRGEWVEKI